MRINDPERVGRTQCLCGQSGTYIASNAQARLPHYSRMMQKTQGRAAALRRPVRIAAVESGAPGAGLFDRASPTGRLMQSHDWSTTALGPVERWSESLKVPLRLMLASPAPTFIWWGRDLIHLHNDACARLFGRRRLLGKPASEIRRDIWEAIGPEVCDVLTHNTPLIVRGRRVVVARNGRDRPLYCTFTLTPIRDEWGCAAGVLGVGEDDTDAVVARQRLAALRDLKDLGKADSIETACDWAAAALAANSRDLPYALVYLADPDGEHASLAGSAGKLPEPLERTVSRHDASGGWLLEHPPDAAQLRRIDIPPPSLAAASSETEGVVVVQLRRLREQDVYLVAGLAKRCPLDQELRAFLIAAAGLISSGLLAAAARDTGVAEPDEARRDEFLAMLAHELRNPLAPIRSAAELLAYVDANPMSLTHAREIIERQLEQLVRLVDDLLDASRLSRGTLELKRDRIDLRCALANAIETVRPLIDGVRHELVIRMPDTPVRVHGDHVRLTQALSNLLTNAAQYTEAGGRIEVSLEVHGRTAEVRVADDGIGLDPTLVPRIFDLFAQGEQRPGEPRHGLGIGLTVTKRLVELHGGTIEARSAGRGKGSEFIARLPLLATQGAMAAPAKINGHDKHARRILVADDNTDAATAMAQVLGAIGHEVRTAEDGLEALEIAEHFRPELILLDIGMPRLDGFETCRRIRQRPWGRDVSIYAVTGWGQASDRRRTREAGFNAHLVKPVSIGAIEELIRRGEH